MVHALVSGYGSDSDSDDGNSSSTPAGLELTGSSGSVARSGLFSSLPRVKAGQSSSAASRLGLPPPKSDVHADSNASGKPKQLAGSKRGRDRLQIQVDTLKSVDTEDGDDFNASLTPSATVTRPSGSRPSHALFGMLPAPKRVEANTAASRSTDSRPAQAELASHEDSGADEDDVAGPPMKKAASTKGNNDFRAMLGLKPSSVPAKAKPKPESRSSAASSSSQASKSAKGLSGDGHAQSTTSAHIRVAPTPAPADFFSLQSDSTSSSKVPVPISTQPTAVVGTHKVLDAAPAPAPPSRPVIQSAPTEEVDPYAGWQQDPDGSWVPVTPEAWAAYQAHVAATASEAAAKPRRSEVSAQSDLAAAGLTEDSLESVDADVAARAWALRSGSEGGSLPPQGSLGPAASLANPKDKSSRLRAKGQLSALIAHANENREDLEKKWSLAKSRKAQAGARYGF